MFEQLPDKTLSALGVAVAAVHEGMDVHVFHSVFLGGVEQTLQVFDVGVHASVGEQTDQVYLPSVLFRRFEGTD